MLKTLKIKGLVAIKQYGEECSPIKVNLLIMKRLWAGSLSNNSCVTFFKRHYNR